MDNQDQGNPHGPGPKSALARLTEKNLCPTAIQPYVTCDTATAKCTETIPGYFKMRTKFTDFTGAYVLHCHIPIHEDRGMMQMAEVVPSRSPYQHH
jgi:hypothetical protein